MLFEYKTEHINQILGVTRIIVSEGQIFINTLSYKDKFDLTDFSFVSKDKIRVFISFIDGSVIDYKNINDQVNMFSLNPTSEKYSINNIDYWKKDVRSIHIQETD